VKIDEGELASEIKFKGIPPMFLPLTVPLKENPVVLTLVTNPNVGWQEVIHTPFPKFKKEQVRLTGQNPTFLFSEVKLTREAWGVVHHCQYIATPLP
jgi:hypothetical protein